MTPSPENVKNILFLAYYFPPRGGSGVQRSQKFAKYLPEFGYHPIVLTCSEKDITATYDSSPLTELNGTQIYRCRSYEGLPKKLAQLKLGPLNSLFLRPDAQILWCRRAFRKAMELAQLYRIDAIYSSIQPWSSALLARKLKRCLNVPWVVDYRDLWTDSTHLEWPTRLHYLLDVKLENRVLDDADAVVVVTPTMKQILSDRNPNWSDKLHLVHNGFDCNDLKTEATVQSDDVLRLGFTGRLYPPSQFAEGGRRRSLGLFRRLIGYQKNKSDLSTHSPCYLLQAVRDLLDENPDLEKHLSLMFAGTFGSENEKLVERLSLQNVVTVKSYVTHEEAVRIQTESDVLFLPMMSELDGRRSYNLSGKVFEYLAARKPILAAVPPGDLWELIERAGAGWCVEPKDTTAIKNLLRKLIQKKQDETLSIDPDEALLQSFERRRLTEKLAGIIDNLHNSVEQKPVTQTDTFSHAAH